MLNLKGKVGVIGVIILASIPFVWSLVVEYLSNEIRLFNKLYLPGLESEFAYSLIRDGPFCVFVIVGLALYLVHRKPFWKSQNKNQILIILVLLLPLALFLSYFGFAGTSLLFWLPEYYARKGMTISYNQLLSEWSPSILLFILWFISGVVLLVDSLKQLIRLKQELEW